MGHLELLLLLHFLLLLLFFFFFNFKNVKTVLGSGPYKNRPSGLGLQAGGSSLTLTLHARFQAVGTDVLI